MNAPMPRILIESMWRGRLFGAQWRPAIGGSLDVLEPATGAVITRVGNATAEDVRQAAAEARAAQPGWAATPYDERAAILRKVGEESVEVLLAGAGEGDEALTNEVADLWFHTTVLMRERGLGVAAVLEVLAQRHRASPH